MNDFMCNVVENSQGVVSFSSINLIYVVYFMKLLVKKRSYALPQKCVLMEGSGVCVRFVRQFILMARPDKLRR